MQVNPGAWAQIAECRHGSKAARLCNHYTRDTSSSITGQLWHAPSSEIPRALEALVLLLTWCASRLAHTATSEPRLSSFQPPGQALAGQATLQSAYVSPSGSPPCEHQIASTNHRQPLATSSTAMITGAPVSHQSMEPGYCTPQGPSQL